jgi:2-polyprenyl-3-methyl-5-hydroxy-6-metoxy-1,4-benzoquinol methylase
LAEHPLEDLFARLERERQEADRLYNEALTAVDRALQTTPDLPAAPRPYDDGRVAAINLAWNVLPEGPPPVDRSIKGRLRGFIWRLVGPPLEAQRRFNAEIVDHLNRNVAAHHEAQQVIAALLDVTRRQFAALAHFESLLVQYLQTITPYLDTKNRSSGGDELRQRIATVEQRVLAMKRELESRSSPDADQGPQRSEKVAGETGGPSDANQIFAQRLDALTYVGFEDRFRGPQSDIRTRLEDYLPLLTTHSNIVDVGCGRGELLDLLRERGVRARGVDTNDAMVRLCQSKGLEVEQSDAVGFLERQPDESLGGLVAIQVVEHFEPRYLMRFLETAYHKLRPNAPLVLETINPACWMAFFECYIRDITHRWPLHPDTLRYLVQTSGFSAADVRFREQVRDADRLDRVPDVSTPATFNGQLAALTSAVNAHADKLNARLFSSMDYAIVARR